MKTRKFLTCPCDHCGGRLEFPAEDIGTTVECPHCANQTELRLPSFEAEAVPPPRARVWAMGGLIVLLAFLGAAFYALHRARQIGARVRLAATHAVATAAVSRANPLESDPRVNAPAAWIVTNEFAVSSVGLTQRPGSLLLSVTGTVRNVSARRRVAVRIELELLDESGETIGQATDSRAVLEPRAAWPFEAPVIDGRPAAARLRSVRAAP